MNNTNCSIGTAEMKSRKAMILAVINKILAIA